MERQEIEALERELAACANTGDMRRVAALLTRSYMQRIIAASGDRVTEFFPATPERVDPLDWIPALVMDLRVADDGRLVALVNYCTYLQVHYYKQEDQQWRLDDSFDVYANNGVFCSNRDIPAPSP